ncbi:MAG: hypothetical protein H0T42_02530 [Deltaproteobacteria bacterium]|nr:hypothetical protein [Deltaproteobacteria bacterium]
MSNELPDVPQWSLTVDTKCSIVRDRVRSVRTPISIAVVVVAACGSPTPAPELPAWDRTLPSAAVMGVRRGLTPARGIVHLHSPYSHDACDGMPRAVDGAVNEPCLASLRSALCTTRIDYANLTDHDDSMADESFAALFSMRGADQPILRGGEQIASRLTCDDGHQVAITIGGENDLMPIMLDRHVAGTAAERHATYNGNDATTAAAFRAAGGLVWVAHTESKSLETLRLVQPDGIEVYNLHANIDPTIRKDYLGLDSSGAISGAIEFADSNPGHAEPDLAMLSFLSPNGPAIDKWHALLKEGRRISVTAGSDAHENAIPILLPDGERGDSYRRVMRWFGNIALVADPKNIDQVEQALGTGRNFALFEILGTPEGFDVGAATPGGQTIELGGTVSRTEGATLRVGIPRVLGLDPSLPTPTIRARVFWIDPTGPVQMIAEVDGAVDTQVSAALSAPGAYRVEITIVPSHLGPYLHDLGTEMAERELPWIYTSPIYVQ